MKDNFNALTEARLEKLEERVHSVEVILLFMTINGLLTLQCPYFHLNRRDYESESEALLSP